MFSRLKRLIPFRTMSDDEFRREQAKILDKTPVPVFWLFGKTGSGKTSVVKYLTGAERAEIGSGFRPQTERSEQYDFPSADAPLMRFLDTRGLGETRYDPREDLRQFAASAHVMIVTVRVLDHALAEVIEPLRAIRRTTPERPVLLALTCLHDAYPGQQHPQPDPFDAELLPTRVPDDLRRSIAAQQERFAGLVDRIVPIDLTRPSEGFDEPHFGGPRLKDALIAMLPAAYRQMLLTLDDALKSLQELHERRAMPYVISHSAMAASAAAVPLPWVDIPVVAAIQSHLVYKLAHVYGQPTGARTLLDIAGPVGTRLLARRLLRGALKFIPYVGSAVNAAVAFAYTYGLGKACCWYFGQLRQGNAPSQNELQRVWQSQTTRAAELWRRHPTV